VECGNCGLRLESNENGHGADWNYRAVTSHQQVLTAVCEIDKQVPGKLDVTLRQDMKVAQFIVNQLASLINGPNFSEMSLRPAVGTLIDGKFEQIMVTVQKLSGLTPCDQRDMYREALQELVNQVQKSNARDDNGHALADLQALHEAVNLLGAFPQAQLTTAYPTCPYCVTVMRQVSDTFGVTWACNCEEVHEDDDED
jgi:hypothetical protein